MKSLHDAPILPRWILGVSAEAVATLVDPQRAAQFAAAIGDENPLYLENRCAERLIAPPMFSVSLTATNNQAIGDKVLAASGLTPAAFSGQLHFTEVLEWHAPLRPAAELRLQSTLAALRPHRA